MVDEFNQGSLSLVKKLGYQHVFTTKATCSTIPRKTSVPNEKMISDGLKLTLNKEYPLKDYA